MSRIIVLLGLASLITACAESAGRTTNRLPTDEEVAAYNATAEFDDQIVCSFERELGSSFRRRVCYTRAQIREREEGLDSFGALGRGNLDN